MRYKTKKQFVDMGGHTYWVNAKISGIYPSMLQSMISQLEAMLSHHSKIHVLRFDLRQSTFTETNERITIFNRRLFKWLKKRYGFKRIGYIWVREQERAKHQHYHYVLIIDGHKVQHSKLIQYKVIKIWSEMSGSCWIPQRPYYNIIKGDYSETQKAIYRISYLAKARGKGFRSAQTKDYSTSRIPKQLATV